MQVQQRKTLASSVELASSRPLGHNELDAGCSLLSAMLSYAAVHVYMSCDLIQRYSALEKLEKRLLA